MSATTADDGDSLDLPPELIRYIKALNEPMIKYSPYFDALMVKRRDHIAFFQDLKDFRCQPRIMILLTSKDEDLDVKALYGECTWLFLESHFAYPWCRSTTDGWFKAEQGNPRRQSVAKQKDEEQLYARLLPIWCGFRVRMMPTDEQIEKFLEREERMSARIPIQLGSSEPVETRRCTMPPPAKSQAIEHLYNDEIADRNRPASEVPAKFNAEAFASEEDGRVHEQNTGDSEGAAAAAKMFIGVAATGFLAAKPKARKYLWKRLSKKMK